MGSRILRKAKGIWNCRLDYNKIITHKDTATILNQAQDLGLKGFSYNNRKHQGLHTGFGFVHTLSTKD